MIKEMKRTLPPLQSGDRLSRDEFHRRYTAMPDVKAELIEGVVFMASPISAAHGNPHSDIFGWAWTYAKFHTPGVGIADNATLMLDARNELQPDVTVYILPEFGGGLSLTSKRYLAGTPEMAIEVAVTSANIDLGDKLEAYQRNGISEYIVWRVFDEELDWFILKNGKYETLKPTHDGIHKSQVFPGLWLDAKALLTDDPKRFLEVMTAGVNSPEHAAFVTQLAQRKK